MIKFNLFWEIFHHFLMKLILKCFWKVWIHEKVTKKKLIMNLFMFLSFFDVFSYISAIIKFESFAHFILIKKTHVYSAKCLLWEKKKILYDDKLCKLKFLKLIFFCVEIFITHAMNDKRKCIHDSKESYM